MNIYSEHHLVQCLIYYNVVQLHGSHGVYLKTTIKLELRGPVRIMLMWILPEPSRGRLFFGVGESLS